MPGRAGTRWGWPAIAAVAACTALPPTPTPAPPVPYAWRAEGPFPPVPEVPEAPASGAAADTLPRPLPEGRSRPGAGAAPAAAFRVQVYAGTEYDAACTLRDRLAVLEPTWETTLQRNASLYKVQVGPCRTRSACEALRDTLVERGFPQAWIVRIQPHP